MDPSAFLEVEYGAEEGPLTDLTEDDIVLLDDEPEFEEPGLLDGAMIISIVDRACLQSCSCCTLGYIVCARRDY